MSGSRAERGARDAGRGVGPVVFGISVSAEFSLDNAENSDDSTNDVEMNDETPAVALARPDFGCPFHEKVWGTCSQQACGCEGDVSAYFST